MKLKLTRKTYTTHSTIGELTVDGKFQCYILEDPVRPEKLQNDTAIDAGKYNIIINHSDKFGVDMPLLEDVPNFAGIRIHPGNTAADTHGCLLPGSRQGVDAVTESRDAYTALWTKLSKAQAKSDPISIEIVEGGISPFMAKAKPISIAAGTKLRVLGDPLNLRSSAEAQGAANIITALRYGTSVSATGKAPKGEWLEVNASLASGVETGWAHRTYLEAYVEAPAAPAGKPAMKGTRAGKGRAGAAEAQAAATFRVANTESLNLRSQAAVLTEATLVASLPAGQSVTKIADSSTAGWIEIKTILHGQELHGFVHSGFLAPEVTHPAEASSDVIINEAALQMILDFEGLDQPSKWPGESSGISLGHGYDLGYYTRDEFETDWGRHLTSEQLTSLTRAIGVTGEAAHKLAPNYQNITITTAMADEVFSRSTIKKVKRMATSAFPGILRLPPGAQGGLASLVYNRGGSMEGDRRREMREIRDTCASPGGTNATKVASIAKSIESMTRLWPDTPGLIRRRKAEAKMVRESG